MLIVHRLTRELSLVCISTCDGYKPMEQLTGKWYLVYQSTCKWDYRQWIYWWMWQNRFDSCCDFRLKSCGDETSDSPLVEGWRFIFRSLRKIILIYVEIRKTCMHILQHFGSSWCCVAEYKSKSMENLIPCALYFIRFSVTGICDQFL